MSADNQTQPLRGGFYWAQTATGEVVAEYKASGKGKDKTMAWFQHVSDDPTVEKTPTLLEGVTGYRKATKQEVAKAIARELTVAEQAQAAYEAWKNSQNWNGVRFVQIPENRRFSVGEKVAIGNLRNCHIVAVYDDGQAVAVRHHHVKKLQLHGESEAQWEVGVWHWLEVDKLPSDNPPARFSKPSSHILNFSHADVESLLFRMVQWNFEDDSPYQRGYAWTMEDKERLIASALAQRELGKIVLVVRPYPKNRQILDGKQRLKTLIEFKSGQFPYKGLHWHELHPADRVTIERAQFLVAEINEERVDEVYVLETFLDVNAAGVPQTEEHLAQVSEQLEAARKRRDTKTEQ